VAEGKFLNAQAPDRLTAINNKGRVNRVNELAGVATQPENEGTDP
jgi:hypothetical protein